MQKCLQGAQAAYFDEQRNLPQHSLAAHTKQLKQPRMAAVQQLMHPACQLHGARSKITFRHCASQWLWN